jgi:hypothetical protein
MKYMVAELMFKAVKAWYKDGHIHMILSDRKEIIFPVDVNKKLRDATPSQLSKIKLICDGTGLHWPDLDEDLSVTGILEGRYGKKD